MTPTQKKYSKYVGEMFWTLSRHWDFEKGDYKDFWNMVMVTGIRRKYGESGDYVYTIETLKPANPEMHHRQSYTHRCYQFIDAVENPTEWNKAVPVTGENPPS